jgi:hypothetical protein
MKNTAAKTTPDKINYNRFVLGLGIGYKIGFFNRPDPATN